MKSESSQTDALPSKKHAGLFALGLLSGILYCLLVWFGPTYSLSVDTANRPILSVIGIYVLLSFLYLLAINKAIRVPDSRWLIGWMLATSLLFRMLLLMTPPFQEIDIYRYLWDGAVTSAGYNPYDVTPQEIVDRLEGLPNNQIEVQALYELVSSDKSLEDIVRTIHYAELPSPYPPVSQFVFSSAHQTANEGWNSLERLRWLKGWLTLFDYATLLLLLRLLKQTQMPLGWSLAYGWCPLVLKEIAGSGHLDSIAIFFTTASVVAGIEMLTSQKQAKNNTMLWSLAATTFLAIGVGAKLYPIVLAPLLAITIFRRLGWLYLICNSVLFLGGMALLLSPMLITNDYSTREKPITANIMAQETKVESLPPVPSAPTVIKTVEQSKTRGLTAFLSRWEMNDLLFMIVIENLCSHQATAAQSTPWFDVTPESWSLSMWDEDAEAFFVARVITLALSGLIAIYLAIKATHPSSTEIDWLRAAFLTIAWFWLLAPTQNPWYWCWMMPLLPFARSQAWRWYAPLLFGYYLRFYLENRYPDPGVMGTPYDGSYFFHYVINWLQHAPILFWLLWEYLSKRFYDNRDATG